MYIQKQEVFSAGKERERERKDKTNRTDASFFFSFLDKDEKTIPRKKKIMNK